MDYNKDEHSQMQPDVQNPQPKVTPDSPAAYGIHRFDTDGSPKEGVFSAKPKPTLGMWESYKLFWQNYVNFSGRSRRSEYWWPTLINSVISFVIYGIMMSMIDVPFVQMADMSQDQMTEVMLQSPGFIIGYIILCILGLVLFLPCISCAVRRLHDLNINGWWYATMLLSTCTCGIVGIIFLILFIQDSKPGTNQWGVSPKYSA